MAHCESACCCSSDARTHTHTRDCEDELLVIFASIITRCPSLESLPHFSFFLFYAAEKNSPVFVRLNIHFWCVNTQLELNPVGPSCSWCNKVTKMVCVGCDSTNTVCWYYPSSQAAVGLLLPPQDHSQLKDHWHRNCQWSLNLLQ